MKINTIVFAATAATVFFLTSCSKNEIKPPSENAAVQSSLQEKMLENGTNPDEAALLTGAGTVNHFYIESNRKSNNTILVFTQKQNGQLVLEDEVRSGGYGYGEGLGSQGALAISKENNLLFAVNAGSNSISSFRINASTGGLQLLFTSYANGNLPTSLTVYSDKLFVLNNLGSTIGGYKFNQDGLLTFIKGSEHNLSSLTADGAQIKFQPDGKALYVTEKATNIIDKFSIDEDGKVTSAIQIPSKGVEPFGFEYGRNNRFMIVANAANGASGAGSATSYKYSSTLGLTDVNGPVGNFESAPCWVATTKFGVYAFTANTASNNISSYYIDKDGVLTLISAIAAANGLKPIDINVSADNKYVFSLYSGSHTVVAYKRSSAGAIEFTDRVTALPDYAAGLAVY